MKTEDKVWLGTLKGGATFCLIDDPGCCVWTVTGQNHGGRVRATYYEYGRAFTETFCASTQVRAHSN